MPIGGPAFSTVRKAREAIKARAHELLDLQIAIIKAALAEGDYETAAKANQFLMEHIPAEDGERMLETSVDKVNKDEQVYKGPMVNIGFQLGGIPATQPLIEQTTLPEPAIDVVPVKKEDQTSE